MIKDLVNGFLVLLEDQYAIGDVIEVDPDTSGLVENLNLRVTQLRDGSGRLITLPNSQISRVVNLTRLWTRMDETVCVDANADIHQALEVVKTTAHSLYTDPQFRDAILAAPEVLGVETINHAGVEIHNPIDLYFSFYTVNHYSILRQLFLAHYVHDMVDKQHGILPALLVMNLLHHLTPCHQHQRHLLSRAPIL